MNKIKKSYVIVVAILTIIVVYIACFKTKTNNLHTLTQIQTTSIDSKSKKLTTYDVLSNGKIKRASKFPKIKRSSMKFIYLGVTNKNTIFKLISL